MEGEVTLRRVGPLYFSPTKAYTTFFTFLYVMIFTVRISTVLYCFVFGYRNFFVLCWAGW